MSERSETHHRAIRLLQPTMDIAELIIGPAKKTGPGGSAHPAPALRNASYLIRQVGQAGQDLCTA
jgi:hypothetical protein